MNKWEEADISHLAKLCRIKCTEEEKKRLSQNLKKILQYSSSLDEVNTEGVMPCSHVLETIVNVMRDDVEGPSIPRKDFLSNAPDQVGGMIKVPSIIKFEE